jgi:hypothetical protein
VPIEEEDGALVKLLTEKNGTLRENLLLSGTFFPHKPYINWLGVEPRLRM